MGCVSTVFAKSYVSKSLTKVYKSGKYKCTITFNYPYFTGNTSLAKITNQEISKVINKNLTNDKQYFIDNIQYLKCNASDKYSFLVCRSGGKYNSIRFENTNPQGFYRYQIYYDFVNTGIINGKARKLTKYDLKNINLNDIFGNRFRKDKSNEYFECIDLNQFTMSTTKIQFYGWCAGSPIMSEPLPLSTYFKYK